MEPTIELRTEAGKLIHGLLVSATPWIYWQLEDRTAHCERCETISEIPVPSREKNGKGMITRAFRRFIAAHEECTMSENHIIVFPTDNQIEYSIFKGGPNGIDVITNVGLPANTPFEVFGLDAHGAWLLPPDDLFETLGGDLGLIRVTFRTLPVTAS